LVPTQKPPTRRARAPKKPSRRQGRKRRPA
jgi:hypothetical protein